MSTLLLRLAGPMQSWGTDSKFDVRRTGREPSKSGVIGLVAAALGIGRQDRERLRELAALRFGVIAERDGVMIEDFHAARSEKSSYITHRYYLSDAVFVAGLESENSRLLEQIGCALRSPAFPLYLGRRSCPPVGRVFLRICDKPLKPALEEQALLDLNSDRPGNTPAADAHIGNMPTGYTRLVMDSADLHGGLVRDVPLSFDPSRREYGYRRVVELLPDLPKNNLCTADLANHDPMAELFETHDPMTELED